MFKPPSEIFLLIFIFSIAPSMFGRELGEQIRADAKGGERQVPVIVEKCIDAVETLGTSISLTG
jgi:Rho-type GTPase-activating protein 1/2